MKKYLSYNILKNLRNEREGFTILYAVLVSSLILALGLGIATITMKEVELSGTGRESQFAFYAADSGAECALSWDFQGENFATSTNDWLNYPNVKCADGQILKDTNGPAGATLKGVIGNGSSATTTFWIYTDAANTSGSCAVVTVAKYSDASGAPHVTIDSRGYNTCDPTSPRRLERGYQLDY